MQENKGVGGYNLTEHSQNIRVKVDKQKSRENSEAAHSSSQHNGFDD